MFGIKRNKSSVPTGDTRKQPSDGSDLFDLAKLRGIAGMPNPDMDEPDHDLEAELAALMADDDESSRRPTKQQPPHQKKVPLGEISQLAAEAMASIDDDDFTDEDLQNPDLLAELAGLAEEGPGLAPSPRPSPKASPRASPRHSPVPGASPTPLPRGTPAPEPKPETDMKVLISERLASYQLALNSAEAAGESSKVRRISRGLKTLKDLDKKLQRGAKIDESEIPPPVATGAKSTVSSAPEPAPPPPKSEPVHPQSSTSALVDLDHSHKGGKTLVDDSQMTLLKQRQHEYKMAALEAKRAGNVGTASEYLKVSKQFDAVFAAIEQGEDVDLSEMPPSPSSLQDQSTALIPPPVQQPIHPPSIDVQAPAGSSNPSSSLDDFAIPTTPLEALEQRQASYKRLLDKAEGNASKCRRLGRIVKSYQNAIKNEKNGKPVDYEELPTLPGFPPIPPRVGTLKSQGQPSKGQNEPQGQHQPGKHPSPAQPSQGQQPSPAQPSQGRPPLTKPPSVKEAANTRNLRILVDRQKGFKKLAFAAKKDGDMAEAMRLLKIAKGFESMITASENGFPVNMNSIPSLPASRQTSEEEFQIVEGKLDEAPNEISDEVMADSTQLYARLIATLGRQIQICATNEKQYDQLGNHSTAKRFEDMKQSCQQDLDFLNVSRSHSDPVPRFHYEVRTIPTIRVFPDLTDNDVEINVIRGTNYKLPQGEKDLETCVKVEFPFPVDEPQIEKTVWGKGFESVDYDSTLKMQITRNRAFSSCVKRRSVKFEVFYSRGFLRSDKLLSQATLKLADLETKCEIHETLLLGEGRKTTAGKLEVKVRIHHPLSGVKEDQTKEKWLVVNSTTKRAQMPTAKTSVSPAKRPTPQASTAASSAQKSSGPPLESLAVLSWELETLKKKVAELQAHKRHVPKEFISQQKMTADKMNRLRLYLKEGGRQANQAYVSKLQALLPTYVAQAKQVLQAGHKDKASTILMRKKLVENEIASMTK